VSRLLLKNGWVVDPESGIDKKQDILIADGVIRERGLPIESRGVDEIINLHGKTVIPGIIDTHVHLRGHLDAGYKMLAKAGVTTAVDFAGPVEEIIRGIKTKGTGINVAVLNAVIPGENIRKDDADFSEISSFVEKSLEKGSYGIKILGGHYPLSANITRRIVEHCNDMRVYVAFHAGTEEENRPFFAFKQAVELAEGKRLHLAHINSYCRGMEKPYLEEMTEAIYTLDSNRNIVSDSYLSDINGTSAKMRNDEFLSSVTQRELKRGGYPQTAEGIKKAFMDGYAMVGKESAGENVLVSGEEGVQYWEEMGTDVMISFSVNPSANAVAFAMHRDDAGEFTVDTISTDGGGIPRNSIVHLGLPLTRFRDFTLNDFIQKTSINPAGLFGFRNKGRLSPGADADITVLDLKDNRPYMTITGGKVIMIDGYVLGRGGTLIVTKRGEQHVREQGVKCIVADVKKGTFFA
jgi:imidazolonepropionase-like amidohydrolase